MQTRLAYTIQWSPGHVDIEGNKAADEEAKQGAASTPNPEDPPTLTHVTRKTQEQGR